MTRTESEKHLRDAGPAIPPQEPPRPAVEQTPPLPPDPAPALPAAPPAPGFYRSGDLTAGPYRFAMSRAGMKVTAHRPGFRAAWGPPGNYVHLSRDRIYYRSTAPRSSGADGAPSRPCDPAPRSMPTEEPAGGTVRPLVPADPHDLVVRLREAGVRLPRWPFALAGLLITALFLGRWGLLAGAAGAPGVVWLAARDRAARSVVIMYDVNDEAARRYADIVQAVTALRQAAGLWQVTEMTEAWTAYQSRLNAGASVLLHRHPATVTTDGPWQLVTNVTVPALVAGRRAVYFLPDRILVQEGNALAAFPYQMLEVSAEPIRFIERGPAPEDGEIVDTTWRFVAPDGGPDPRLSYNRSLPVLRYGRLTLRTDHGLRLMWDVSRPALADAAARALAAAATARPPTVVRS